MNQRPTSPRHLRLWPVAACGASSPLSYPQGLNPCGASTLCETHRQSASASLPGLMRASASGEGGRVNRGGVEPEGLTGAETAWSVEPAPADGKNRRVTDMAWDSFCPVLAKWRVENVICLIFHGSTKLFASSFELLGVFNMCEGQRCVRRHTT